MGLLTLLHWLGFLLDEIFYRGYRRPVFIVGIPRSGTTWLQRVLAQDDSLTSLTLWECLVAPSVSERRLWRSIGWLFRPLAALVRRIGVNPLTVMARIHKIRLQEPEEDFLLLLPLHACLLLVFLCPQSRRYWDLARFDLAIKPARRQVVMHYYYRCLQKHLYVHGVSKRLLSKNPSFTPYVRSLRETFPDARFIFCVREPVAVVGSQLSSLEPVARLLYSDVRARQLQMDMLRLLQHYYGIVAGQQAERWVIVVPYDSLIAHLGDTVEAIYGRLALSIDARFRSRLAALAKQGRSYQSGHRYDLSQFGLNASIVTQQFAACWPITHSLNK